MGSPFLTPGGPLYRGPLGGKFIIHLWVDEQAMKPLAPYSVRQAELETMDALRRAALIRLTGNL